MRLIGAVSIVFILAMALAVSGVPPGARAEQTTAHSEQGRAARQDGQAIFRFDTFGDEQLWTDVLRMHEVIPTIDPAYAARSATGKYRTTPLRGLLQHPPYFHDGSAPDLFAVVNHYDALFGLDLTEDQKADLVEYLKSL